MADSLPLSLISLADTMIPQVLDDFPTSKLIQSSSHAYANHLLMRLVSSNELILSTYDFDVAVFSSFEDFKGKLLDFGFDSQVVAKFLHDYTEYLLVVLFSSPQLLHYLELLPSSHYS